MKEKQISEDGVAFCLENGFGYSNIYAREKYKYQKRQGKNQIHYRVYHFNDWGKEEHTNFTQKDFIRMFAKCI